MRATQMVRHELQNRFSRHLGGPPLFQLKEGRAMTIWVFKDA
jgi:hypothetical protein